MNNSFTSVSLGEFLTPVSRQEDVIPEKVYPILGSHWYAKGLYVKDVKPGSEIQADKIYRVEKGDFVYNRLFAWKGSFAIALEENNNCYVSNEFPCFEVNQARVDSHYLWQYFSQSSIWNDALGLSSGGTPTSRNRLKEEKLLSMKIPLPPLEEQQRIVARIEELATRIEEARGLRREAVEETEALVNVAARNLLAFTNIEPTELRCWTALDRDGIQTGPFGAQLGSQDFESTGVPVLTIGNIQYYGLELNSLKYVSEEKAQELSRFSIKEGDIIFARMGTVGRCCVVPPKAEGWLFNYHIIRVALDKARVNPRYIHWSIRASLDIEEYLGEKIRGATREGVNSSIVGSLPMRVPSLSVQNNIVTYLDNLQAKVDTLQQLQAESSAELNALLPSILDKAFKGEL